MKPRIQPFAATIVPSVARSPPGLSDDMVGCVVPVQNVLWIAVCEVEPLSPSPFPLASVSVGNTLPSAQDYTGPVLPFYPLPLGPFLPHFTSDFRQFLRICSDEWSVLAICAREKTTSSFLYFYCLNKILIDSGKPLCTLLRFVCPKTCVVQI